ncbi:protein kinase domain-containing protein [Colletotrichum simmondsii]|uniref:Protein kinase domain-containing protein n=1 Tax=Colletotrichum simmondsii TaxID=703756 RepID=A0A135T360_9PEZI|nr:protein kinase domain-containing protein [Colletotrichum simmondsii]
MASFEITRIYDEAKGCEAQFEKALADVQHGKAAIREYQQRFWAWATNTGVFAEPFLSLDARLDGHDSPVNMIVSLLKLLKGNLEAALRLDQEASVQGEQERRASPPKQPGNEGEHLHHKDEISHLEGPFYGIDGCIQRLARIATLISRSSQKSRPGKVESFAQRHRTDLTSFENLIGAIVDFKFPNIRPSFKAQLVRSATYRRQSILYQRYRNRRREAQPTSTRVLLEPSSNEPPGSQQGIERQFTPMPTQKTQMSGPAPSESLRPSTFDGEMFKKAFQRPESKSDLQSTASAWTGEIQYPQAPRPSDTSAVGLGSSECPYCLQWFSQTEYDDEKWWRKHVNQDLRPYICVSEQCAFIQPPVGFEKYYGWREHMEKAHGADWTQHIHNNTAGETGRRSKRCPMCDTDVELLLTTAEGHDSAIGAPPPVAKTMGIASRVRFQDDDSVNDAERSSQQSHIEIHEPQHDLHSYRIKLSKHISKHLLSWCFQALRMGLDETDNDSDENEGNRTTSKRTDQGNSDMYSEKRDLSIDSEEMSLVDLQTDNELTSVFPSESQTVDFREWEFLLQRYDAETDPIIANLNEKQWSFAKTGSTLKGLRRIFRQEEIELYNTGDAKTYTWIPLSCINQIIRDDENIVKALEEKVVMHKSIKRFVFEQAKRLVSLLIYRNRLHLLQLFYNERFGDEHFPIKFIKPRPSDNESRLRWSIQSCRSNKTISVWAPPGGDISDDDDDQDEDTMKQFCRIYQWYFFVPVFGPQDSAHVFDPRCQMPYLEELGSYQTNFSVVRHFVIHRKHLNFKFDDQIGTLLDGDGNPHIAVKELLSAQGLTWEMFHEVAENEAAILRRLKDHNHPHIIKALATYTQGSRHYFVFPWARGGNLRDFWINQPNLSLEAEHVATQDWSGYYKWFFKQLLGLSSAIEEMHYPKKEPQQSCRHGDLKPENILCFSGTEIGQHLIPIGVHLVVADVGHAKVHEEATERRYEPTITPRGTMMYSPPEAELRTPEARSRRYDIWSLGCLYLEFLIWMLYGNTTLEYFRRDIGSGQPYYRKEPEVGLKDSVKKWIKAIEEDPRCIPTRETAIGRLINLIENRMLIVKAEVRRDATNQDSTSTSETRDSSRISTGGSIKIIVKPPMLEQTGIQRADSREVYEEIESIFNAARKPDRSLPWINQDGIAEVARRGPPTPQRGLAPGNYLEPRNRRMQLT